MTEPAPSYNLIMPFVACRSRGGAYEDDAFVAGWRLCQVDRLLSDPHTFAVEVAVPPADIPQVDLIAMRYGYTVESEPWADAPDEWVCVKLRRAADVPA